MIHKKNALALAAALLSLAPASQASTLTLDGFGRDGLWLNSGNHDVTFSMPLLPPFFKINSVSYAFDFRDDLDNVMPTSVQQNGSSTTDYVFQRQDFNGYDYQNYYRRSITSYTSVAQKGEAESVSLSLGGINMGSGSTAMTQSEVVGTSYSGSRWEGKSGQGYHPELVECGFFKLCVNWVYGHYDNYSSDLYQQTTTRTTEWGGDFSITGNITDTGLLQQMRPGNPLHWNLGVAGDLMMMNARMVVDIDDGPAPPPIHRVPEPPSLVLLGLGLLGLAGAKRRRRSS